MTRVKIFGAGSIGNHLAQAARQRAWDVVLCDVDPAALERTKTAIFPGRYGDWDEAIHLCTLDEAPVGGFDFVFVGTPPDSHVAIARTAVAERPRGVLVEKPFCTPDLNGAAALYAEAEAAGVRLFTGYDHVVSRSVGALGALIDERSIAPQTLDVEFREHWSGIFAAHPWLAGPWDTYLGFWRRGGGACGEHSHAINLWQHLAHCCGAGRVISVQATMDYVAAEGAEYDRLCLLNLTTETGLVGRVVQDVVTRPPRKWARLESADTAVEWHCLPAEGKDSLFFPRGDGERQDFAKTRPDDFLQEILHLEDALARGAGSPISGERGLDTMLVIAAAHRSAATGRTVAIDYTRGYTEAALA